MRYRRPRQRLRPRWAVILPLLATLAFWCAVGVGLHRWLGNASGAKQAVNSGLPDEEDRDADGAPPPGLEPSEKPLDPEVGHPAQEYPEADYRDGE